MRGGTNWRSIIQAPEGHWAFSFLEVQDFDGTWVNLGYLAVGDHNADFLNAYDLEDDIDRNTLTFSATLRGSVGAYSIMPFRSDSPLNVDAASTYQPLLDLHRQWRLWVCFTPKETFPTGPGDYRERARGIVDRIDLSFSRDEIRVQGRGPEADLIDHLIIADETTPKVYAAGPVADVLQAMLDDQFPGVYTLVVDGSAPSTFIDEITYTEPVGFWKLFSDTAAVGTGIVRFLYADDDTLAIHLFTPDRSASVPQWSVGSDEYGDIENGLDQQTITNYIVARFVNASGTIQTVTSPATPVSASIARYGLKTAVITLAANIGLSDATRVQAMIDAIRADRELPILGQVITGSGLWFGELWDYVGTPANGVLYNEDQAGGVVGYHESGRNSVIDTVFTLAGKPKGRYATWLEISSPSAPTAADLAPGITSSSATFKEVSVLFFAVAAVVFVGTVNGNTQSVTVDLYSDAALTTLVDSNAYDVTSAAPLNGAFLSTVTPLARDIVYYVKLTPYSGPLVSGVPSGVAGDFAVANTNVLPEPTDSATLTWDRSDPAKLQADVIAGPGSGIASQAEPYTVWDDPTSLTNFRKWVDSSSATINTATPDEIAVDVIGVAEIAGALGEIGIPIWFYKTPLASAQWLTMGTIPASEEEMGTEYRRQHYLVGAGRGRWHAIVKAVTGAPTVKLKSSTDAFSSSADVDSLSITGTGYLVSPGWTALPSTAQDDVRVSPFLLDGAGTASVDFYALWYEVLPDLVTAFRDFSDDFSDDFS